MYILDFFMRTPSHQIRDFPYGGLRIFIIVFIVK